MSANMAGELKAEPNLTPLLDMVFQLITFFMLVFNISESNFDTRIKLPIAAAARPVEGIAGDDKLILNVDDQGNLIWEGKSLDTESAATQLRLEAQGRLVRLNIAKKSNLKLGDELPTTIIFRADRRTPFSQIYRLITACQAQGFRKFSLKAMTTSDEG